MKKIFILYNIDGKTLRIAPQLSEIIEYAQKQLKEWDKFKFTDETAPAGPIRPDTTNEHWVNEYAVYEEVISVSLSEILEAIEEGESPDDLSMF